MNTHTINASDVRAVITCYYSKWDGGHAVRYTGTKAGLTSKVRELHSQGCIRALVAVKLASGMWARKEYTFKAA